MFLQNTLLWTLSFRLIVRATPLQSIQNSVLRLSPLPNIVDPILPSNASILALDASGDEGFNIRCDGDTYGYNPNIRDCEAAKEYLLPDTKTFTFGERHTGLPEDTIPLPYRVMGDKALCYFQAVLIGDHTTAQASLNMLRRSAAALVVQCATSVVSQGGIATNIGGDNNLAVILGTYHRPVSCRGALPTWESCKDILFDMPANKLPQVFGSPGDPTVTEDLPYRIESYDVGCSANLFSTGKSDVSSFYEMWEAAIAVFCVCARYGRTGSVRGLGEHSEIFLTMTSKGVSELPSNSSEAVSS